MSIFDEIDNYVDGLGELPDFKGASSDEYYGTEKSEKEIAKKTDGHGTKDLKEKNRSDRVKGNAGGEHHRQHFVGSGKKNRKKSSGADNAACIKAGSGCGKTALRKN